MRINILQPSGLAEPHLSSGSHELGVSLFFFSFFLPRAEKWKTKGQGSHVYRKSDVRVKDVAVNLLSGASAWRKLAAEDKVTTRPSG